MRFTILLLSFGLITNEGFSRPSQAADNGEEYVEYEEKDSAADEYLNDKPEKEVAARSKIQDEDARSHASYKQQSLNNNEYENLMEDRININKNENRDQVDEEPFSGHRKSNPGLDETEDEDLLQPHPNTRFNTFKRNHNNEYRSDNREIGLNDGNMIESDRRIVKDKSEYNNEAIETREEPLYKQITYYTKVQGDLFHKKKPNSVFNSNRDRRETIGNQQENLDENRNKEKKEADNNNEDNITAIKRNIKKLSREELEDLLNSLSDDKKALLNKIIGTKISNDNLNKREITKKAGAVEENNCLENSHSDLNKLESGSFIDSISSLSQSDTTESTKQSESGDASKTKTPESSDNTLSNSESKDDLSDVNLNIDQESVQSASDAVSAEPKDSVGKETINKRETNFEDVSPDKSEVIENYDSDKDVDWSELMKDETELHKTYSNLNKRELDDYSNTADVKSLEDSFPYYEAENPKSSDSQMAPLIRVKRTNSNGKRASGRYQSNMKVPFIPAAVNDEDDTENDEFDYRFNFENSYNYDKIGKEGIHRKDFSGYSDNNMPTSNKNMIGVRNKSKFKSETDSIGSDTDNVLSNREGVDDNLMYKNEIRRKRDADDANLNKLQHESSDENAREGSVAENDMTDSLSKNNLALYQDQDAFGSIQRTSDEEVGRYKRIRRLKQLPTQENIQNT